MMMNGRRRRRRQQADVAQQDITSGDDGSSYPRISSRTGGYESSVASHLVSSTSDQASWSTAEDTSTVKADNTTTATSQELLMFRIPALIRESPSPGSGGQKKKAGPRQPAISSSKASLSQQRSHTSSSWGKQSSVDSSSTIKSNNPGETGRVGRAGGRAFLRKLVDSRQAFRVSRNNTEATVDAASEDSRSSPQRTRFVLPDNIVAPSPSSPGSAAQRKSYIKQQGSRFHPSIDQQESDGYEVLSNPTNKTMTVVHSSLTLDSSKRSKQQRRMIVDSDLIETDCLDDSSSSSSFSQLLMTDGDLMKNQERYGTGVIRLTVDSLKEHEEKHDIKPTNKIKSTKQPPSPSRNLPFAFWRKWRCMDIDPVVPLPLFDDETEKSRIELKRQEYLKAQRQREFGSVTKEQRDSIFDSLVDSKSRATHSTTSSAASQVTPRCSGCPTTGAMVDTVSFWYD